MTLLATEENRLAFELMLTLGAAFVLFVMVPMLALYLFAR